MPETRPSSYTGEEGPAQRSLFASSLQLAARHPAGVALVIAALLLVVIVLQNLEPTSIDLLFWSIAHVPKLVLILGSMLVGALTWELARRYLLH